MGQSVSSRQQEGRENAVSSEQNPETGRGRQEAIRETSQLRRSRRIRDSISQIGGRFVNSNLGTIGSEGIGANAASSAGTNGPLRIRNRVRTLSSRSSFMPSSSTQRSTSSRIRFSLSRPLARNAPNSPTSASSNTAVPGQGLMITPVTSPEPPRPEPPPAGAAPLPRSRLSRARSSISTTLPNLFAEFSAARSLGSSSRRNSQAFRHNPSLFDIENSDIDGEMELDTPSSTNTTTTGSSSRNGRADFPVLTDSTQGDLSDNPTRARPGEDQAAMLSRLLSVAAAMTAASLVGSSEQAFTEAQDVAGDNGDNSFESFLRALQNGRLAAALRNGGNEMGGGVPVDNGDGSTAPLNFFRMFRFGASPANATDSVAGEAPPARMVPVIIVGIRSVTPRDNTNPNNPTPTPPFFDALANLPVTPPPPVGTNRGASSRSRLVSSQRRASVGAIPAEYNRPRRTSRPTSEILFPPTNRTPDTSQSSQASPSATTDTGLPLFSNGTFAPRASGDPTHSAEEVPTTGTDREPFRNRGHSTPPVSSSVESSRSSTGSTSNSSAPNSQRRQEGTRSWIIYVLGGSYPENHPILTTPSLFTDSPTYEDMMLLSSLLGPAKPPVASQEDVNSAGGLFVVGDTDYVSEAGTIRRLQEGDRCLVCLSDFEKGEQCRSLTQCQHIFHKECIDEWLTTGRNSCPLCRAQGVEEKEKGPRPTDQNPQPSTAVNLS